MQSRLTTAAHQGGALCRRQRLPLSATALGFFALPVTGAHPGGVARPGPGVPLAPRYRDDIDRLRFVPLGAANAITWAQSLAADYIDGIVVLHRRQIVYERYFGALQPETPHIAMSVTKRFVSLIGATRVAEGRSGKSWRRTRRLLHHRQHGQ